MSILVTTRDEGENAVMVKRQAIRSYTIMLYVYTTVALMMITACWEGSRNNAALAAQLIPQESIRLRILADSDAPQDQWIKRQIRDALIERMSLWVQGPQDIESAREIVRSRLGDLEGVVGEVLSRNGFADTYTVELGPVPFPAKMYGNVVYPAGVYEALLVTVGSGQGQNWWCVLFPPLCFVDLTAGEAIVRGKDEPVKTAAAETIEVDADRQVSAEAAGRTPASGAERDSASGGKTETADGKAVAASEQAAAGAATWKEAKPEVRFFVWDLLQKAGSWVKTRFFA